MKPPTKIASGPTGIERQLSPLERAKAQSKPIVSLDKIAGLERETKPSDAVKRSRAKNPEAYRAYMREYMRKRRAKII